MNRQKTVRWAAFFLYDLASESANLNLVGTDNGLLGTCQSQHYLISLTCEGALGLEKSANMGHKRKKNVSHEPRLRKVKTKRIARAYEDRTGDIIYKAEGRTVHENAVRRGGLEPSIECRDRALQKRVKSGAEEAVAELKRRDATEKNQR